MSKAKFACYWAASCGGCDIAILEIGTKILDIAEVADIVFWPCVFDFKYSDVESMDDNSIDICLFNGAIRTSEQEYLAKLLRRKSKVLVAYGSCACEGCIPGLSNVSTKKGTLNNSFLETPSTDNPDKIIPQTKVTVPEGELELPEFYETVKTLKDVVDVDYFVPGCPPVVHQTWNVLKAFVDNELPEKGSVIGANKKAVCDECPKERDEKAKIKGFKRPHEIILEDNKCLLEHGIICMGPATRGGCEAQCPVANMPCRGCYGPPEGVVDQGMKMLSAISSMIDSNDPEEIEKIVDGICDPLGTLYRFGLPNSTFKRVNI